MILQFKCKNVKQESEVMEMGNLEVRIEVAVDTKDEIKEIVKIIDEIRKEYSCDCTLILKE